MKFYLNPNENPVSPHIIRGCLVNIVIQPVCIHTVTMCSPCKKWLLCAVIVWDNNSPAFSIGSPFAQIPLILLIQCHPVVLRMSHHKNLSSILCHDKVCSCLFRLCQNLSLSSARIFSIGTSVCLECGA